MKIPTQELWIFGSSWCILPKAILFDTFISNSLLLLRQCWVCILILFTIQVPLWLPLRDSDSGSWPGAMSQLTVRVRAKICVSLMCSQRPGACFLPGPAFLTPLHVPVMRTSPCRLSSVSEGDCTCRWVGSKRVEMKLRKMCYCKNYLEILFLGSLAD